MNELCASRKRGGMNHAHVSKHPPLRFRRLSYTISNFIPKVPISWPHLLHIAIKQVALEEHAVDGCFGHPAEVPTAEFMLVSQDAFTTTGFQTYLTTVARFLEENTRVGSLLEPFVKPGASYSSAGVYLRSRGYQRLLRPIERKLLTQTFLASSRQ